ncbi:MAG TPA: hypothetical protein VE733_00120 [Streptosporangiaceae bacterium]|jgi:hypothetical protein|nr:hypothetical protein [Streptosporangiaceae bacterium]
MIADQRTIASECSGSRAKLWAAGLGAIGDLGFTALDDDPNRPMIITVKRAARNKPLTGAQEANRLVGRETRRQ